MSNLAPTDAAHALLELRRVGTRLCDGIARWSGPPGEDDKRAVFVYLSECQAHLRALSGALPDVDDGDGARGPGEEARALERCAAAARRAASTAPTRLLQLCRALGASDLELDLLLLAALPEESSLFGTLFAYLAGQTGARRPTVQLALNFCAEPYQRDAGLRALCAGGLLHSGLLRLEPSEVPLADRMLSLAPEVWPTLCGIDAIDPLLRPLLRPAAPTVPAPILPPAQTTEVEALADLLADARTTRVVLTGPPGSGRRTLARWLAARAGRQLVEVHLPAADAQGGWGPAALRHALLRGAGLLLVAEPAPGEALTLPFWPACNLPMLLCLPARGEVADGTCFADAPRINLELPRVRERTLLWARALGPQGGPEPALLARRYHLSGGEIDAVAQVARGRALLHKRRAVSDDDVAAALRTRPAAPLETLAQRRHPQVSKEDLILAPAALSQVEELLSRVSHRDQVFHEWGLASGGPRQTGTVVLFVGPSGTGKTLAAEVLAAQLGLDLYSIDLSRVVSKYIGDTERNLARVFDAVEGAAAVLFFDEADALFGRRTETRDAHDRYANLEVSYLLTRLESFSGLAVLSSNLRQNMDPAFLRRLHFIIEFNLPDEEARRRLWQRHLRSAAPLADDIDVNWLAEVFVVSGGHIRNAVVAAAFRAASAGGAISREHLIAAMKREYEKLGRAFPGLPARGIASRT